MLTREAFHEKLREFIRREPFVPFVVELHDGRSIQIDEPTVAFGNDLAGYISPDYEILEFRREEVSVIRHESDSTFDSNPPRPQ